MARISIFVKKKRVSVNPEEHKDSPPPAKSRREQKHLSTLPVRCAQYLSIAMELEVMMHNLDMAASAADDAAAEDLDFAAGCLLEIITDIWSLAKDEAVKSHPLSYEARKRVAKRK